MEKGQKREEPRRNGGSGKDQDPYPDSEFLTAISRIRRGLQEPGYEPYDQLTRYVAHNPAV